MRQTCGIDLGRLYNRVGDDRPRTAGEAHGVGMTLLREPKAPVRRRAGVRPDMDAILHDRTYSNLCAFIRMTVGGEEYEKFRPLWHRVAARRPRRLHEALLDMRLSNQEGRKIHNAAAYLITVIKSWPQLGEKAA